MKFKKIILLTCVAISCSGLGAKSLNSAGIRLSDDFGITAKIHYKDNALLEGIVSLPNNALIITALYEKYFAIEGIGGLQWYYGGGVFMGINNSSAGIKGVLGLCCPVGNMPVEVSVDWMPALTLIKSTQMSPNILGLSVRYKF